jgi:hypothetical protein
MRTVRNWWWIPLVAVFALFLKAALLTPWVAARVEDAAVEALRSEGLDRVAFVSIDGVDGLGGDGMNVVLEGPAVDRSLAISVVQATDEIDRVSYRSSDRSDG